MRVLLFLLETPTVKNLACFLTKRYLIQVYSFFSLRVKNKANLALMIMGRIIF